MSDRGSTRTITSLLLTGIAVVGLAYDAYVHLNLAGEHDAVGTVITQGWLFRFEAAAAILAALALVVSDRRAVWAVAGIVGLGGLAAVMLYRVCGRPCNRPDSTDVRADLVRGEDVVGHRRGRSGRRLADPGGAATRPDDRATPAGDVPSARRRPAVGRQRGIRHYTERCIIAECRAHRPTGSMLWRGLDARWPTQLVVGSCLLSWTLRRTPVSSPTGSG